MFKAIYAPNFAEGLCRGFASEWIVALTLTLTLISNPLQFFTSHLFSANNSALSNCMSSIRRTNFNNFDTTTPPPTQNIPQELPTRPAIEITEEELYLGPRVSFATKVSILTGLNSWAVLLIVGALCYYVKFNFSGQGQLLFGGFGLYVFLTF